MKRRNSEDLIVVKDDKGSRLFSKEEIKLHTVSYYKKLYTKRVGPNYNQQWTHFINNKMKKYIAHDTSNEEEYNKNIALYKSIKKL